MPVRVPKTTLCLLLLLAGPLSGLAGRAEASLVLRKPAPETEASEAVTWLDTLVGLERAGEGDTAPAPPARASSEPAPSGHETDIPRRDSHAPLPFGPVYPDLQHSGAGAPDSSSSSGSGAGATLHLLPPQPGQPCGAEASGLLFLADDRFQLPSFPTRLFRPPRGRAC